MSTVLQVLSAAWHRFSIGQSAHFGLRAKHNARPCRMIWCAKMIHLSRGLTFIRSCSIFLGSLFLVSSRRREMRCTCVSTTTPSAILNHVPKTTLAVLRATPGICNNSSILRGTSPPKSLNILRAAPTTDFDLLRKNPVVRMSGSSSSGLSAAKASIVGYLEKITGVTMLTRTSVHCAESMVATSNSHALLWCNAHVAEG